MQEKRFERTLRQQLKTRQLVRDPPMPPSPWLPLFLADSGIFHAISRLGEHPHLWDKEIPGGKLSALPSGAVGSRVVWRGRGESLRADRCLSSALSCWKYLPCPRDDSVPGGGREGRRPPTRARTGWALCCPA